MRFWKNSSMFELTIAMNFTRSSSGIAIVLGLVQHAPAEVQVRQLAVEVELGRAEVGRHDVADAGRRRRAAAARRSDCSSTGARSGSVDELEPVDARVLRLGSHDGSFSSHSS